MIGKVIVKNAIGKALVQSGPNYYIIPAGGLYKGEEVVFEEVNAFKMPSYLFALSMMAEDDFEKVVRFIKDNW